MKLDLLLICLAVGISVPASDAGVTEEQMWAAGKLMRDVCLPKFPKVSVEVADGIKNGKIPNSKDTNCYINCVLEMMQAIKKGKFQVEASLKQMDVLLPESYKAEYRQGIAACKDSTVGLKNAPNCDPAQALLSCLKSNIKVFVFP
ncbi:general odorant-binding protein 19a [Drosophila guanche]|uniref:Blast:General odorant-binding protein 19a n=1 Tax=Drosophila guanche TaxID=7266 RepID=A0A3B0J842_DROGU|nr:general odorant-binding protein 19a [Drosophila guanche]SPP78474.1 blast:General odorant-binding protein 19a [Drosophila guanche]